MLIADTNEFHPLTNGVVYRDAKEQDGTNHPVVILRATYSSTHVDNAYPSSLAQARGAGLLVGHYGYMVANVDAGGQGAFFGQTVKAHGGLLPGDTVWCDCEEGAGDQSGRVQAFLTAAHAVLTDNPADEGVYSGAAFWSAHLGATPTGVHRWIAAYGQAAPNDGQMLFQFTDNRAMAGVSGNCDCSIFNGTVDQYRTLVTPTAAPAQPAPTGPTPTPCTIGGTPAMRIPINLFTTDAAGWYAEGLILPAGKTKDDVFGILCDAASGYDPQGWHRCDGYVDFQDPGQPANVIRLVFRSEKPSDSFTARVFVTD